MYQCLLWLRNTAKNETGEAGGWSRPIPQPPAPGALSRTLWRKWGVRGGVAGMLYFTRVAGMLYFTRVAGRLYFTRVAGMLYFTIVFSWILPLLVFAL